MDKLETIREEQTDRKPMVLGQKIEIEDEELGKPRFEGNLQTEVPDAETIEEEETGILQES